MRIVLDTNALVSGLLSAFGPPAAVVRMVASGEVTLCVDARILSEYRDVLARPKFAFDPDAVAALLDWIEMSGETVAAAPLSTRLPDVDDEAFLEVAQGADADCLVTGDAALFPAEACIGMAILTPAQFVDRLRSRS